jgi:hypothetical protein
MAQNASIVKELLASRSSGGDERGRSHRCVYQVKLLTSTGGTAAALTADDGSGLAGHKVPDIGATHPVDTFARVVNKTADSAGDFLNYTVSVEYDTRSRFAGFTFTGNNQTIDYSIDNPLLRPWVYRFGTRVIERPVEQAYRVYNTSDAPVVSTLVDRVLNSADVPFDPPVMEEDVIQTMSVTRWEGNDTYTPLKSLYWQNRINATDWTLATGIVWPKWTARVVGITASSEYIAGYWWWNVTYELEMKWDTWLRKLLNYGWMYIDANNKFAKELDAAKQPIDDPSLLDDNGHLLARGATPTYRTWLTKRTADFSTLFNY